MAFHALNDKNLKTKPDLVFSSDASSFFGNQLLTQLGWHMAPSKVQFFAEKNDKNLYDIQAVAHTQTLNKRISAYEPWIEFNLTRYGAAQYLYAAEEQSNNLRMFRNQRRERSIYSREVMNALRDIMPTANMSEDEMEALQMPTFLFSRKFFEISVEDDDGELISKDLLDDQKEIREFIKDNKLDMDEEDLPRISSIPKTGAIKSVKSLVKFAEEHYKGDYPEPDKKILFHELDKETILQVKSNLKWIAYPTQIFAKYTPMRKNEPAYTVCVTDQEKTVQLATVKAKQGQVLVPTLKLMDNAYQSMIAPQITRDARQHQMSKICMFDYNKWHRAAPILDRKFCVNYGW